MVVGNKGGELTADDKGTILNQMMSDYNADKQVPDEDKHAFDSFFDLSNFSGNNDWGFDPEAVWDCLRDIFPDLWY